MDSDLAKQQEAFKRALQNQPIIQRHVPNAPEPTLRVDLTTPSVSASSSSLESVAEEFRFDAADVRHVNSYVHAIISLLKV